MNHKKKKSKRFRATRKKGSNKSKKIRHLRWNRTKKRKNISKKNYVGGVGEDLVYNPTKLREYTDLIKEIIGKDSQFNYILRTYYYEVRDNPDYAYSSKMEPPTQSSIQKIQQINLKLFCWIRDNVPGSTVVLPKGAILARTVSRKDINQINIEMKEIPPPAKPAKPAVFGNTSQLANSTIAVGIPIDSVMFMKTTRKLIYLNLCPFQHLMQTYWKTRMDNENMKADGTLLDVLENITGISANTLEWCNSGPIQEMEYDGIIQNDLAEAVTVHNFDEGYFVKDERTGKAKHNSDSPDKLSFAMKIVGKDFADLAEESLTNTNNQVMEIIDGRNGARSLVFPEFLTYSYNGSKTLEVCDLQKEYKLWYDTMKEKKDENIDWPNNIKMLGKFQNNSGKTDWANPHWIIRLLTKHNLPLGGGDENFNKYINDFSTYNTETGTYTDEDGKVVTKTPQQQQQQLKNKYDLIHQYYGNPEDLDFKLYSLALYEDLQFQKFGVNITNIEGYKFNQRSENGNSVKIDELCIKSYKPLYFSTSDTGYQFNYVIGPLYGEDQYQKNIDLLHAFKNDLCNGNMACNVQSKNNTCCDIQEMQGCDQDKYPGSFMTIKGDATNNFYYNKENRTIVSEQTKDLIDNIVYKPTQYNYPLYVVIYHMLIKNASSDGMNSGDIVKEAYFTTQVYGERKTDWSNTDVPKSNLYKYVKDKILRLSNKDIVLTSKQEANLNFTYRYLLIEILSFLLAYFHYSSTEMSEIVPQAWSSLVTGEQQLTPGTLYDLANNSYFPPTNKIVSELNDLIGKDSMYKERDEQETVTDDEPRIHSSILSEKMESIITKTFQIKVNLMKKSNLNRNNQSIIMFKETPTSPAPISNKDLTLEQLKDNQYTGFLSLKNDNQEFWSLYKDSLLGIFFNLYLKGGTAFRLLFKRETLIEETCISSGTCSLNRLTGYRTDAEETEKKINDKLGQPSDYDLNCVTNPWLGETDYKILVDQLNIQINLHLKERTYVEFTKIFNPHSKKMEEIQKSLANNYYNKDSVIITDIKNISTTAAVEKDAITGERSQISRSDMITSETNAIPMTWRVDDGSIATDSFVFYSQGHMLWITTKLLDEATEFDLHRLMLHIPTKSAWINENKLVDRYKAIKNTKTVKMQELLTQEDIEITQVPYGPNIENTLLKEVPTNVDTAVELIDVSVVNWGGIEKFSKWHDSEISNLRAEYLYNNEQKVLYTKPGEIAKKAQITNVYSVPYYYDIVITGGRELKDMTPQEYKAGSIQHIHSGMLQVDGDTRIATWSEGLQMYNFDNSIHDLTLVIDDNIKSGRVTKLLKRQRRRAFLAQLRYLFVNNNPTEKDFKDPDGPMEIYRFEGYEPFYFLLDRPDIASKMIQGLFKTNISFNIPLLKLKIESSPAVKLLNLDEWPRMYILLKATLERMKNDNYPDLVKAVMRVGQVSQDLCMKYDIENKILIPGEKNVLTNACDYNSKKNENHRKSVMSNIGIIRTMTLWFIIEGLQQNLDIIYTWYLNTQEIPGSNKTSIPERSFLNWDNETKDILLKYFLNMLTLMFVIEDKSIDSTVNYKELFQVEARVLILTDMCNTLYTIIINKMLEKISNNTLKTLCEVRIQYVKKAMNVIYKKLEISTNPSNINKVRLAQQLKALNTIGSWIEIAPNEENFSDNNQLILELESCKGFYDTMLHSRADYQNYNLNLNKVTINITDKDKYKTFKQRLKDENFDGYENSKATFADENETPGCNYLDINYEKPYIFNTNETAISISISSMINTLYSDKTMEAGFKTSEAIGKDGITGNEVSMWDDYDNDTGKMDTVKFLQKMYNNSIGFKKIFDANTADDSPFLKFEPICTCQMLLNGIAEIDYLKPHSSAVLSQLFNNRAKSNKLSGIPQSYIVLNGEPTEIPNWKEYHFSPDIGSLMKNRSIEGDYLNIMTIDVINSPSKLIKSISENWKSMIDSLVMESENNAVSKREQMYGKIFPGTVDLEWYNNDNSQIQKKKLELKWKDYLVPIWGKGWAKNENACPFYCVLPSVNTVQYRKMIEDTKNVYVKETLLKRMIDYDIASNTIAEDILKMKAQSERLKDDRQGPVHAQALQGRPLAVIKKNDGNVVLGSSGNSSSVKASAWPKPANYLPNLGPVKASAWPKPANYLPNLGPTQPIFPIHNNPNAMQIDQPQQQDFKFAGVMPVLGNNAWGYKPFS